MRPTITAEDIRTFYDELDKQCGIDTSGIELHINSRLARRHGQCHYKADMDRKTLVPWKIDIAGFLVNNPEGFWNTARHEYAHALVTLRDGKQHGHDKVWQAAAAEVGAIPRAYNTIESAGKACEAFRKQNAKYHLVCEKCGKEWFYMRETAVIRNVFRHVRNQGTCPCCRGHKFKVKELR